jgi:hypothetical protein
MRGASAPKCWRRWKSGRPESSRATTSPSTTVSGGRPLKGFGDVWVSFVEILAVTRVQNGVAAGLDSDGAIAVQLDFVGPIRALGQRRNQGAFHRLDKFSSRLWDGQEPISARHVQNQVSQLAESTRRGRCGQPIGHVEEGRYILLDFAETLSTFMVNDLPDPVRFLKVARDLVAAAAKAAKGEHFRVAACGECAPLGRDSQDLQHGYFVPVCIEQLSARTGKPHLQENLCGTLSRLFPVNGPRSRCSYPAARMEWLPELRGTRAWIVVPRLGCDSTESVPFRSFSRSSMLVRPSPRPSFAPSTSNPAPESLTVR